jgi:hypothetical protein
LRSTAGRRKIEGFSKGNDTHGLDASLWSIAGARMGRGHDRELLG